MSGLAGLTGYSDINATASPTKHTNVAGLTIDIAETGLDRVLKILSGISGGVYKAVGSALSRAASAGQTEAKRPISKAYTISQSQFLRYTRTVNHFQKGADSIIGVEFGFAGYVIPLMQFNTTVNSQGTVSTQVMRNSSRTVLDHAFQAKMGSHTGVYERVGTSRFPVKEFYGPSTPQMMFDNEEVLDAIEAKMAETYEKRIDHEILRVLNGWGV